MIVVRDIFQLKFGQSKEATAHWKQGLTVISKSSFGAGTVRLLTDMAGLPYYTLILESTFSSAAQWEEASKSLRADPQWRDWYAKVPAFTESGRREILATID